MKLLLEGGRLLCPETGLDEVADLLISDGKVAAIGAVGSLDADGAKTIRCEGLVVAPSLVDLSAELCDPGRTWLEDLQSGSAAAAAGGFTTVLMSPRTDPVIADASAVRGLLARVRAESDLDLQIAGALTVGLAGEQLAEVGLMIEAGAAAISDGGYVIGDSMVVRHALLYAGRLGRPILMRPGEPVLESGTMHEGEVSTRIGMRGIPASAEVIGVTRLVALAEETGTSVHLCGVTTAQGVAALREAKKRGAPVTASVSAHNVLLTDAAVADSDYNTNTKLSPPLRSEADRQALVEAVRDGTIDALHSGHAPRNRVGKELEYALAESGAVGLETALSAAVEGLGDLCLALKALGSRPARVLGMNRRIEVGAPAELVILNASVRAVVAPENFLSKCTNSPLAGRELPVVVQHTLREGRLVYTRS